MCSEEELCGSRTKCDKIKSNVIKQLVQSITLSLLKEISYNLTQIFTFMRWAMIVLLDPRSRSQFKVKCDQTNCPVLVAGIQYKNVHHHESV